MTGARVVMLLENDLYPQDVRVRDEAHSLRDAGYSVHVIAPRGPHQTGREVVAGVEVERYRTPREQGSGVAPLLLEYAIAHLQLFARGARALARGADVVHLHNPPDSLFPVALLARALRRRVVFDQHDLFPELFVEKFGATPLARVARALQALSVRTAHLTVTTNASQRESALRAGRVDPRSVVTVRNAPPDAALQAPTRRRKGTLEDPRLLYLGALEPQDGVDLLPELVERLPRATLTVVGWGTRLDSLKRRVEELGVSERVTFTGRVDHHEALHRIAQADICVDVAPCSPLNHRTTMVKIAEYMALGKPVVSFDLAETRATGGDALVYAPCGDVDRFVRLIDELAEDGEHRGELGRRARERARGLVWSTSGAELVAAYANVLGGGRRLRWRR